MKAYHYTIDRWILIAIFLCFVVLYVYLYAPYGFDFSDHGFIPALSWSFYLGKGLYNDLIFVRPPTSIVMHSIIFLSPFNSYPILIDRAIFYLEVASYSFISAMLAAREFKWTSFLELMCTFITFMFCAHSFPPMGWPTVDGIFFSCLALLIASSPNVIALFTAALFAILAAGSKQPFYLTPILISLLVLQLHGSKRFAKYAISLIACAGLYVLFISSRGSFGDLVALTRSEATINDLIYVGIKTYLLSPFDRSSLMTFPLGLTVILAYTLKINESFGYSV